MWEKSNQYEVNFHQKQFAEQIEKDLAEKFVDKKRFRITTGISVAALIVSILSLCVSAGALWLAIQQ